MEERRQNQLTKEDVKEAMAQVMEVHMLSDQHQFLKAMIEKQHRRQELWTRVKTDVASKGVLAVLSFIGLVIYTDAVTWFKHLVGMS